MTSERIPSPIDEMDVPDHLEARVVCPGPAPLLHGYDVQHDLARHYDFGEVILIALTGDAPSKAIGHAFNVLLTFLAPIGVGEAPSHAALLSRLCGARPSGVASVAAIALAEQARFEHDERAALFEWLARHRAGDPPAECLGTDDDRQAVARLHAALDTCQFEVSSADERLGLSHAIAAALHDCGLHQPWQQQAVHAASRYCVAIAEAMAVGPSDLGRYPIRVPDFEVVREAS